jgi:Fe-S cluster biogenesis protein NfuA
MSFGAEESLRVAGGRPPAAPFGERSGHTRRKDLCSWGRINPLGPIMLPSLLVTLGLVLSPSLPISPSLPLRAECSSSRGLLSAVRLEVVSPFDGASSGAADASADSGPLELTMDNVDMVLEGMRPYLMADGGNVAVRDIDGGVVKLELQGACGTCPSSTMYACTITMHAHSMPSAQCPPGLKHKHMRTARPPAHRTMKMGLERGLRERIPEIIAVEQVEADGPQLTEEGIEEVLDEIRPFLKMAGGSCDLVSLDTVGVQPTAQLKITGNGATINSVRIEIAQRLKRNVRAATIPKRMFTSLPMHPSAWARCLCH